MDIQEFKNALPPYKAVLGFDYGSKRLGIAVSDLLCNIASAYKIWSRATDIDADITEIKRIVAEKEIGGIVYGLPLQMDGSEGDIAREVREFAYKIAEAIDLPYMFWDERLSSAAVERFLIEKVDLSRAKRKKILDASAAAYILQGALDAMHYL